MSESHDQAAILATLDRLSQAVDRQSTTDAIFAASRSAGSSAPSVAAGYPKNGNGNGKVVSVLVATLAIVVISGLAAQTRLGDAGLHEEIVTKATLSAERIAALDVSLTERINGNKSERLAQALTLTDSIHDQGINLVHAETELSSIRERFKEIETQFRKDSEINTIKDANIEKELELRFSEGWKRSDERNNRLMDRIVSLEQAAKKP